MAAATLSLSDASLRALLTDDGGNLPTPAWLLEPAPAEAINAARQAAADEFMAAALALVMEAHGRAEQVMYYLIRPARDANADRIPVVHGTYLSEPIALGQRTRYNQLSTNQQAPAMIVQVDSEGAEVVYGANHYGAHQPYPGQ